MWKLNNFTATQIFTSNQFTICKSGKKILIFTLQCENVRIRVPSIWTKLSYQKKGYMRVVSLHKDSKNVFGLNLALKPRSHKVRKGLLSRFTKQN